MKTKLTKIFGIGFAFILIASMMVFAIPAAADPYAPLTPALPNTSQGFPPTPGILGGYFYDDAITKVGPIAEAINGDLYAYVANATGASANDIFKSVDGGRSWYPSTAPLKYAGGAVVDMVCSSVSEDVLYVTDGNYVYKSIDGGATFMRVAEDSLETNLIGNCGATVTITGLPITCIDLTYDATGKPIVFIGTQKVWDSVTSDWRKYIAPHADVGKYVVGSVYWIADETFPAAWADLKLSCYGCCAYATSAPGCFNVFSIGAAPDFATSNKVYVLISKPTTLSFSLTTTGTVTVTAGAGGATIDWTAPCPTPTAGTITDPNGTTNVAGTKALAGLATGTFVANAAIAPAVKVDVSITSGTATFAVTAGTASICNASTQVVSTVGTVCSWTPVAELFWNCDSVTPNRFEIRHGSRFAFGDDFSATRGMFIGVAGTTGAGPVYGPGGDVYFVADTIPAQPALDLNVQGYISGCLGLAHANINSLDICGATDSGSLVAGALDGYQALTGDHINTNVWYSNDGGWSWAPSAKDPTGANTTYVIFYDDCATALAATNGCSCAVSMSCGETVGQYFNQIALIDTSIDQAWDMSHAPGYVTDSTTMYVLTYNIDTCTEADHSTDLFRWDGTYWERVYSSMNWEYALMMDWVEVSPDFNDTGCLYLANSNFRMFRSVDQGCSWRILAYPCAPLPIITAWTVVDEETVLAAGSPPAAPTAEFVYKTDRHGTRPWTFVPVLLNTAVQSTHDGVDFDLSPSLATDNNVLLGDDDGRVYISKDLATTPFNEITDVVGLAPFAGRTLNTYVVFDPGYGTAGDPGETMIYAAAGALVGRCALNSASPLSKQDWVYISNTGASCDPFAMVCASGIGVAGDTTLYVSDTGAPASGATATTVTGTVEIDCLDCSVGGCLGDFTFTTETVHVTGTTPFIAGELVVITGWNLVCSTTCTEGEPDTCAFTVAGEIDFVGLSSGAVGYISFTALAPTTFNCPTCACTGTTTCSSVGDVIGGHLVIATTSAVAAKATGIWRTLNPMDLMPPVFPYPLVEWEFLPSTATKFLHRQIGLAGATGVYSDDLWITQASNMLWTLETTSNDTPTNYIWMWEDPLAAPVVLLAPADGELLATSTTATISWNALDGALYYEVYIYSYCPSCPTLKNLEYTILTPFTCLPLYPDYPLLPGTKYYWKVRVACDEPFVSKWSELRSFDTALSSTTKLCSPICGASDIVPTTNYSWDAVPGATGYELQVVAASADGTVDWTGATTYDSTTNAFASIPGLEYSTVYYWRVRAVNDGVYSAWSECIFTTMEEPVAPVEPGPPVVIEQKSITPTWIWVIIGIGGALTIAVVILIVTTRRVP
jgi:hypothetical protein